MVLPSATSASIGSQLRLRAAIRMISAVEPWVAPVAGLLPAGPSFDTYSVIFILAARAASEARLSVIPKGCIIVLHCGSSTVSEVLDQLSMSIILNAGLTFASPRLADSLVFAVKSCPSCRSWPAPCALSGSTGLASGMASLTRLKKEPRESIREAPALGPDAASVGAGAATWVSCASE